MEMEGRMCKICNKVFSNGRALGGHMRSHLVTLPLPSKKPVHQLQLSRTSTESTTSAALSCDHSDEDREIDQEKILMYGLRENPKRSFRMADPEFLDHGGSGFVVQEDRESETEVTRKTNPTRKRSKRARVMRLVKEPSMSSELEPVLSSVSDQISAEEDVALCLMMLSRDVWSFVNSAESSGGQKKRSKYKCETCDKVFDSFQALGGHKTSHRKIENEFGGVGKKNVGQDDGKLHECPFCYRVFGSGQALGGHKRSHILGSSTTATASDSFAGIGKGDGSVNLVNSTKAQGNVVIIDLNLPAPTEDEENSAVSDAQSPLHL